MTKAAALRVSLLVAMGIVPPACGGTTRDRAATDGASGSGGSGRAGGTTVGSGGSGASGGTTIGSGGVTSAGSGGAVTAGAPSPTGGFGGTGGGSFVCKAPRLDPQSGLVVCDEGGYWHRPHAEACDNAAGQAALGGAGGEGPVDPHGLPRASGIIPCSSAGDCDQFQWGYCDGEQTTICRSGCVTDSDCGADQICVCSSSLSPTGGECHAAACATDADCPGSICASQNSASGCGIEVYRCVTERDRCVSNQDCPQDQGCLWDPESEARQCDFSPVCGRPFLVAERPRLPPIQARGDWGDTVAPRVDHLTPSERAELAQHWTKLGQMEHASIAAFARFSLQLLALGAPPELVEACTAALADETAHAKLCFGIASAYAGRPIGPGPLDVSSSLELTSLVEIVDLVILEGCIGETTAALEAVESADSARDPVIRAAYTRIAADEQRHAELAFRFVKWAIATGGDAIQTHVASAIEALPASLICEQVVRPCLDALCTDAPRAA